MDEHPNITFLPAVQRRGFEETRTIHLCKCHLQRNTHLPRLLRPCFLDGHCEYCNFHLMVYIVKHMQTSLDNLNEEANERYSKAFFDFFKEKLGVSTDRGYVSVAIPFPGVSGFHIGFPGPSTILVGHPWGKFRRHDRSMNAHRSSESQV